MKILLTGSAGFIGFHAAKILCETDNEVIGIDNLNDYYDVSLKLARLNQLEHLSNFHFIKSNIANHDEIQKIFETQKFDYVIHLAAQAGVRFSIENPHAYINSNLTGFLNILEGCRNHPIKHLVFASSSSVYGLNENIPFVEDQNVDHPVSFYGATKKSNEVMAHSYSHLYNIPITGLRYFTVYGPWGRPDMSPFIFAKSIMEDKPINVFNYGNHRRDFTYIDDIVKGTLRALQCIPTSDQNWSALNPKPNSSRAPYKIYNIGNSQPVELLYYIECLEKSLGKKAIKELLPVQPGDVEHTFADSSSLMKATGYNLSTPIEKGVEIFVKWFLNYYYS
jgi:UDP-glucuronate 4-epimerase